MAEQAADHITQLVADFRLAVAYASRVGKLPDEAMLNALTKAETRLTGGSLTPPEIVELTRSLNAVIRAIDPVTLLDLGSSWRPYVRTKWEKPQRFLFAVGAVVIMVMTGYSTQLYTQVNTILAQLVDVQSQDATDKAERLFRFFVTYNKNIVARGGNDAKEGSFDPFLFDSYLKSYEQLLSLSDKSQTYRRLSQRVTLDLHRIFSITDHLGLDPVQSHANDDQQQSNPTSAAAGGPASTNVPSFVDKSLLDTGKYSNAIPSAADLSLSAPHSARSQALVDPSEENNLLTQFLFTLGIGAELIHVPLPGVILTDKSLSDYIYELQLRAADLGIWFLPALYGLLGAVVRQMRTILNPLLPNPQGSRLIYRLALGSLAGVSASWIVSSQKILEGSGSPLVSFGLAFLLGFSVDSFFALLDGAVERLRKIGV